MRLFTLLFFSFFMVATTTAQYVVVNKPADIAGGYVFNDTDNWGRLITDSVWTADAIFIEDGSALPNEGCEAATNDLTGLIALIDRGTCNFSTKALNAQNAGAIAAVIINHTAGAGAMGMGAGVDGASVTIPVVSLSYEDGQILRGALANGPINMSIGNVEFENEISTGPTRIFNAIGAVVPAAQVDRAEDYVVNPGGFVDNAGSNQAVNVTMEATITKTVDGGMPTQVYNESAVIPTLDSDSSYLFELAAYDAGLSGEGVYELSYEVSADSVDGVSYNNTAEGGFYISDNAYCRGSWDHANNRPFQNAAYRSSASNSIEMMSGYYIPHGTGYTIDSVQYYISAATGTTLAGINVVVNLYEWVDGNEDNTLTNDEVSLVGYNEITYDAGHGTEQWTTLAYEDFFASETKFGIDITGDDKYYIAGVKFDGIGDVFFGFDLTHDNTAYFNDILANAYSLFEAQYFYVTEWNSGTPDFESTFRFTDLYAANAAALYVNETATSTKELTLDEVDFNVYPNPTTDFLSAEVNLTEQADFLEYKVLDIAGRTVFVTRKDNVQNDKAIFNVDKLPKGEYFLKIRTENGLMTKPFFVQ